MRYVVVGGFAVIAHGVQRSTADLDICPDSDPENLARLASLLRDLNARHAEAEGFQEDELPHDPTNPKDLAAGGSFRFETSMGSLVIMQCTPGIRGELAYPTLARDAITADVRGVPVSVCSREHLLLMKRAANRPLDQADIDQLGALTND